MMTSLCAAPRANFATRAPTAVCVLCMSAFLAWLLCRGGGCVRCEYRVPHCGNQLAALLARSHVWQLCAGGPHFISVYVWCVQVS